ncbi:hypothetical protein J6590_031886 [Homalodisca vitripennis]|nr:hypothetical protein J6590_031886 [Homalodisca vitripennis]
MSLKSKQRKAFDLLRARVQRLSQDNQIKQRRAWLLLGWVAAERSCPCKQPACPAVGGGSEVSFKPLVPRLSVRKDFLALTSPGEIRGKKPFLTPGDQRLKGDFRTTANDRAGGLLARTGSLSGHSSKQQPRSRFLIRLSCDNRLTCYTAPLAIGILESGFMFV